MNVTTDSFDDLIDVGLAPQSKMSYWSIYVSINFIACFFCFALILSVIRLPSRTSSDIFVGGLCCSCFLFSATCGLQCLLNAINGHFAYGTAACYAEALFHFISVISMFFVLSLMAFDSYRMVAANSQMGTKKAFGSIVVSWVITALGVGLFSLGSPIYMAPSGVFCFFGFDSLINFAFVLPVFTMTLTSMAFFYLRIFQITRAALNRMSTLSMSVSDERKKMQMRLAQKLLVFVLLFFGGWCAMMIGIVLKLATGDMHELDAIGGVISVFHSTFVPIAYGIINPRLRQMMLQVISCGFKSSKISSKTEVVRIDASKDGIGTTAHVSQKYQPRSSSVTQPDMIRSHHPPDIQQAPPAVLVTESSDEPTQPPSTVPLPISPPLDLPSPFHHHPPSDSPASPDSSPPSPEAVATDGDTRDVT